MLTTSSSSSLQLSTFAVSIPALPRHRSSLSSCRSALCSSSRRRSSSPSSLLQKFKSNDFLSVPSVVRRFRKRAMAVPKPVPLASAADASSVQVVVEEEAKASVDGELVPEGLSPDLMPRHVAVIMDGNGRWAKGRALPASAGHQEGVRVLKEMVKLSCKWGIRVLTVFAFSSENWLRPKVSSALLLLPRFCSILVSALY